MRCCPAASKQTGIAAHVPTFAALVTKAVSPAVLAGTEVPFTFDVVLTPAVMVVSPATPEISAGATDPDAKLLAFAEYASAVAIAAACAAAAAPLASNAVVFATAAEPSPKLVRAVTTFGMSERLFVFCSAEAVAAFAAVVAAPAGSNAVVG